MAVNPKAEKPRRYTENELKKDFEKYKNRFKSIIKKNKRLSKKYSEKIISEIENPDLRAWVGSYIWFRLAKHTDKGLEPLSVISDGYDGRHNLNRNDLKCALQLIKWKAA